VSTLYAQITTNGAASNSASHTRVGSRNQKRSFNQPA
jgi:hypothetical protein